jgi:outer membrane receptor protein involved in Fe transport
VLNLDLGGPLGGGSRRPGTGLDGARSRWTVGVHNLLDHRYRVHASGIDAPGLNVVLGLHLSL